MKNVNEANVFGSKEQVVDVVVTVNAVKYVSFTDTATGEVINEYYEILTDTDCVGRNDKGEFINAKTIRVDVSNARSLVHRNPLLAPGYAPEMTTLDEGDATLDGKDVHWAHASHLQELVGCRVHVYQRCIAAGVPFRYRDGGEEHTTEHNMVLTRVDSAAIDFSDLHHVGRNIGILREYLTDNVASLPDAVTKTMVADCVLDDLIEGGAVVNVKDAIKKSVVVF